MQPCTQVETISKIEKNVALTNKDILYMKEEISDIKEAQKLTNSKLDTLIDRLDTKYASKWVEWVIKGMIGIVLATVLTAVLIQVIKK